MSSAFRLLGFGIVRCQSRCLFLEQDGVKPSERQSVGFFISIAVMLVHLQGICSSEYLLSLTHPGLAWSWV